jgi:hypothetical protein
MTSYSKKKIVAATKNEVECAEFEEWIVRELGPRPTTLSLLELAGELDRIEKERTKAQMLYNMTNSWDARRRVAMHAWAQAKAEPDHNGQ